MVIPNTNNKYSAGFRDPKVIWYEDESLENGGIWVLVACGDKAMIFTSTDLIHWEQQSIIRDKVGRRPLTTECPDLFPLECEGETKWVLFASGAWYVIGELGFNEDGKMEFITETDKIWPTNGVIELWGPGTSELFPEAYAAQTFYNTELGRRIQMNWIRDFASYPGKLWYSTLSLPTELVLEKVNGEYKVCYKPIKELEQKRGESLVSISNKEISSGQDPLAEIKGSMLDIHAVIDPQGNDFGFMLHKGNGKYIEVRYDAKNGTVVTDKTQTDSASAFKYETKLEKRADGTVEMRIILDTHSVEAWSNDTVRHLGNAYISNVGDGCEFYCDSAVKVVSMQVYTLSGMDRSSMTKDMANLNSLYGELKALADNKNAPISEVKQALERYNALTSGQKYCMLEGAELVAQISQRSADTSSFDPLIIIIPVAVVIIAVAVVILVKKAKKG